MANTNDVIVLDLERFPKVGEWGTFIGARLGLQFYSLDEMYWGYIPKEVHYLRLNAHDADLGYRYWGEIRGERSTYGTTEEGTTDKLKEKIDESKFDVALRVMKQVTTLAIQEVFEKRETILRAKYSHLEMDTWADQLAEATAYLADNATEVKLIDRLAEVRGLTLGEFAAKIVAKNNEWKTEYYDLAVKEQELIAKVKACKNNRDANVFLEDYFGIEMTKQQCLEYNRCYEEEGTGRIVRKEAVISGIRF